MTGTTVAFSGKGGSGKTTLSALVLRRLLAMGRAPVLAVDADPNATLALTLGVETRGTIADLRDRMGDTAQNAASIPKEVLLEQWLGEILTEERGFDLLALGRPEGPRCYCYVNHLLRRYLSLLRKNYACVVVDCEAGMEYLSRLVIDDVGALVLVAEATPVGLATASRIAHLADSLSIRVARRILALNKVTAESSPAGAVAADALVRVPFDPDLAERCARGQPIDETAGSISRAAIQELTDACIGEKGVSSQPSC